MVTSLPYSWNLWYIIYRLPFPYDASHESRAVVHRRLDQLNLFKNPDKKGKNPVYLDLLKLNYLT